MGSFSESGEVGGAGWVSALSPGAASMPQAGVSGLPSANHSSWQLWTRSIVSEAGQSPQWSLPGFPQRPEVCYNP